MSECVYFITGLRCALSYEMKPILEWNVMYMPLWGCVIVLHG